MVRTNVVKKPYTLTCKGPDGTLSVCTVSAESRMAAMETALPEGWSAIKAEEGYLGPAG